ncbi:hypothetical protein SLA2020_480900 [Shorea laevis]
MAETKSAKEPALPTPKRKADLSSQDHDSSPLKAPKIETHENNNLGTSGNCESSIAELKTREKEPAIDAEEDEDGDYEDEDDDEGVNGDAHLDKKGKGILIEEEGDSDDDDDDNDDDDSSDSEEESDGDSDLSDDPLAEVDLDNILPSRTRRRVVQPGVYIANDLGNKGNDEDSDNSDA